MNTDQVILFGLLFVVFGMLIWGRVRYDLIAFGALVVALITGVVPEDQAFSGFGHHATIIIALVLVLSKALSNSGAIELVARFVINSGRKLSSHIAVMSGISAILSAIMNNVAALALLMPIDMQAAEKAKRELDGLAQTDVSLPFITADATGPKHMNLKISRSQFENMVQKLVDRTLDPCKVSLAGICKE